MVGQAVSLDNRPSRSLEFCRARFPSRPERECGVLGSYQFVVAARAYAQFLPLLWSRQTARRQVDAQSAQAEMTAIARQMQRQYPTPGRDLSRQRGSAGRSLSVKCGRFCSMLLGGSVLLLVIACVNVASLVLLRSESRRREMAVSGALGATPGRLVRAVCGRGILFAIDVAASRVCSLRSSSADALLAGLVPKEIASHICHFLRASNLNRPIVLHSPAVCVLSAALLLAGTAVLRLSFQEVRDGLAGQTGDRRACCGAGLVRTLRWSSWPLRWCCWQAAGLLGQSLYRLLHVPLGFDPDHLATVRVMAPGYGVSRARRRLLDCTGRWCGGWRACPA